MGDHECRQSPLQQVTSKFARDNAGKTLDKPISLNYVTGFLKPDEAETLASSCPDGRVYVWGAKLERIHQFVKMLPRQCLVLFRRGGSVYKCGVIVEFAVSIELADYLMGRDKDGETWALVFFLKRVRDLSITTREINCLVGRQDKDHWQGLVAIEGPAAEGVIEFVRSRLDA